MLTEIALLPRAGGCVVPLTIGQQRWWQRLAPMPAPRSMRMCAMSVRVSGPLDVGLLKQSVEFVVARHESLRTRIVAVEGMVQQRIDPVGHPVELIDLTKSVAVDTEGEALRLAQDLIDKQVDISTGPVFEARMIRLSDQSHVVVAALDRLLSDGMSYALLAKEIWATYADLRVGRELSMSPSLQFADYAVWQQQTYEPWLKEHGAYWREHLANAPETRLPVDGPGPEISHSGGVRFELSFGPALTASLREVARCEKTLVSLVFLAVYWAAIARWLEQRDLIVTLMSHGRHRPELKGMIGPLGSYLHLRLQMSGKESFHELLQQVTQEFHAAYRRYDFDRVSDFMPECRSDVCFNWLPTTTVGAGHKHAAAIAGALDIQPFPRRSAWSNKFLPFFIEKEAEVRVSIAYLSGSFAGQTIARFARNMLSLANELVERPHTSIWDVALTC